jgi:two-component system cell cycle response regulator CpdR
MPRNILVADDDVAMLSLYTRIFSKTDYTLSQASSFTEAAGLIRSNDYDLLITDMMFPDGLGTELIKLFDKKRDGAKSMLVTGSGSEIDPKSIPAVAGYFEKPFKLRAFMAAVDKVLA